MSYRNSRGLVLMSLGLVGFHLLTGVAHSVAHEALSVKVTRAQLAFIVPVIFFAPLVAGFLLLKFKKAGAALLLASMVGSFVFGLYYHFVAETIDHVAHVARLEPACWSATFRVTAYLLAASEVACAAVAVVLLAGRTRPSEQYAARTDF